MRKMTKVLAVTALLALGASFTSMAAAKNGEWKLEDEGWMCYDKDGDAYEDEWCLSYGKEYFVGDDGVMVTSDWVEFEGDYYYVNSAGEKVTNAWRFVTPVEDEDADAEWYYFKASGKRAYSEKRVIEGKTYYFDNEGKMLTGWVDTVNFAEINSAPYANAVYCDEDGARVSKVWVKSYAPEVNEEEEDLDAYDEYWYYLGAKGAAVTGKQANINGQTYFFGEDGKMLSGWVAATDSDADLVFDEYEEIGINGQSLTLNAYNAVYFCGDAEDGHAKKNTWIKEWKNTQYYAADEDNSTKWFWIAKDGQVFVPTTASASAAAVTPYSFEEGALVVNATGDVVAVDKKIGEKTYAFNANGEMVSGFVNDGANMFYYGGSDDGAKKTGNLTIADDCGDNYKFCFATETTATGYTKYAGVTGAKSGKLYDQGLLVTATDGKYYDATISSGLQFVVNGSGTIQTSAKVYKNDETIILDASTGSGITFVTNTTGVAKGSHN